VPRQITGDQQTFTVTLTLDREEVYGRIEAKREIVVRR
jgi:hypothetical protein